MTDPLDVLREPVHTVDPEPAFARDLRARLERALLNLEPATLEETVTVTETRTPADTTALHAVTPYLAAVDAAAAVEFYVSAFGARRRGEPIVMPDGRVGHVEVALGDSVLMLSDEFPEMGLLAPATRGGPTQSLRLEVADPDAILARAVAHGGLLVRPVADSPYGRSGVVLDPPGHRWIVSRSPAAPRPGEIVYASLWTPDVERAERFYSAVLGWATTAGPGPHRQVTNAGTRLGMSGGQQRSTLMACYAVPDLDQAVALVGAAGGTAANPVDEPYGRVADCVDDQALPFALWSGPLGTGTATSGGSAGEVAHLVLRVPDAGRARAFYGTVLGWRFTPGRVADGWNVRADGADPRPRVSIWGGHSEAALVPAFTVDDVRTAVRAVHAAGGSSSEPEPRRYGLAADCVDDQGGAFQLVQR